MNTTPVTGPEHSTDNQFISDSAYDIGASGRILSEVRIPLKMKFYNDNYECVGTIHFGDTITFEGDSKAATECFRGAYDVPRHVAQYPTTADADSGAIAELREALERLSDAAGNGNGTYTKCYCGAEAGQKHKPDCPVLHARNVLAK